MEKNASIIALPPSIRHLSPGFQSGLEKESLRITLGGSLACTPHPTAWGAALTHPQISTDFSEALVEWITRPTSQPTHLFQELGELHAWSYRHLPAGEQIWPCSMPCPLPEASDIPIADYGPSHWGRLKTRYRMGLAARYGKPMQMIAGVHFNISFPDALCEADPDFDRTQDTLIAWKNKKYFGMMRQCIRYAWMIPYLFGASPAVDTRFISHAPHPALEMWDPETYYAPYATSLRLSPLGYRNPTRELLQIDDTDLTGYLASLSRAMHTPYAPFQSIAHQLSPALLQIENEYYATVRPKSRMRAYERISQALAHRGVEYLEIRTLDVDPFSPLGMDPATHAFMVIWSYFCWLSPSPPFTADERHACSTQLDTVLFMGRKPGLVVTDPTGHTRPFHAWGQALLEQLVPIAEWLDTHYRVHDYTQSLSLQIAKFADPDKTPSAQVLHAMEKGSRQSFASWGLAQAQQHAAHWARYDLHPARAHYWADLAAQSRQDAARILEQEQAQGKTFEQVVAAYLAGD